MIDIRTPRMQILALFRQNDDPQTAVSGFYGV